MNDASLRWKPIVDRVRTRLALKSGAVPGKLEAVLDEAVATYDSLLQELAGLEVETRNQRTQIRQMEGDWDYLFRMMPVACVMTDVSGTILRGNDRAGVLLNTSVRHLERENPPLTYFAQDRQAFFDLLRAVSTGSENVRGTLPIRPRERAPLAIDVFAVPRTTGDVTLWLWFLVPSAPVRASEALSPAH